MAGRVGRERIAGAAHVNVADAVTERIGRAAQRDVFHGHRFVLPHRTGWAAAHGLSSQDYQRRFDELAASGYRLIDVSGWWDGGQQRFAAMWETGDGPAWQARHGIPIGDYQAVFDALAADGHRPVRLSFYATPSGPHVAGLWHGGPAPAWTARHGLSGADFQQEFDALTADGYRLVDVSGYEDGGQARYAGVWEKSGDGPWAARHGIAPEDYQAAFTRFSNEGLTLRKVTGFTVGTDIRYCAIWEQRPLPAWSGRHGVAIADWQRVFDDYYYQGYRPRQIAGFAVPGDVQLAGVFENADYSWQTLQQVDQLIDAFMTTHDVPGLTFAISDRGRLVYARARGWADKTAKTPVQVTHRMRIASVSKPITSAAVMKLVQDGTIAQADAVLGSAGRLGTTYGTKSYGAAELSITVDHLLTHTSGFQNSPNDPMFAELSRDHASLIGWVLDNRDPVTTPGSAYMYLNFGYCLLGRIIERVTGKGYADHVLQAIAGPAGIHSMAIAGDTAAARAADEVVYYGQGGEDPYSMKVARMDAHGGWIANAPDLLRFLRLVDGRDGSDILTASTVTTMTTGSAANSGYARGWTVDAAGNWDHNGSLPGTFSVLRRRADGTGDTVLMNTRSSAASFVGDVYGLLGAVRTALGATLPDIDLF
jgi:CubicO group peptidase (beta-lactamase class C family)